MSTQNLGYSLWKLMVKIIKPLNPSQIDKAKPKDKDYNLFDGDGMYLLVRSSGKKVWMFRFKDSLDKVHIDKSGTKKKAIVSFNFGFSKFKPTTIRQNKSLNNRIEQDQRFIKKKSERSLLLNHFNLLR